VLVSWGQFPDDRDFDVGDNGDDKGEFFDDGDDKSEFFDDGDDKSEFFDEAIED